MNIGLQMMLMVKLNYVRGTITKQIYGIFYRATVFRTREEAEFYKEKLLVTAELQRFADEQNEEDGENYYLCYVYGTNTLSCLNLTNVYGTITFSSYKIGKQAIETIGAERIKKYYLGVEND